MKIIAITQTGINKKENEDRIIIGKSIIASGTLIADIVEGAIAVADGVGGHKAGSIASHFVANRLSFAKEITTTQMEVINDELLDKSHSDNALNGMATTLSGIYLSDHNTQLFNIGNSRTYILQSRKYLKQITTDDTTLNYLLATGQLLPEDAENFNRKNEITACFGGGSSDLFKIKIEQIESLAAPIMITSDGIHDYLTVDQMEDIIEEQGLCVETCEKLIMAARENGSVDDASIILGGV